MVSKRGDIFSPVVISMTEPGFHIKAAAGLRFEALRKRGLDEMDYLPLEGQTEVEAEYKAKWKSEPAQQQKISVLRDERGLVGDALTRTIASDFSVALFERFGGRTWFKIFVATGEVTNEHVDMVNEHNAAVIRQKGDREPSSSYIGGARLSARSEAQRRGEEPPQHTGVRHTVTMAKSLRRDAASYDKKINEEKRKYNQRIEPTMTWPQWHELLRRREAIVAAVAGE